MNNTYLIREIRRIYDDYVDETMRLEKDRKVNEGLMGFGGGPGTHPCHDRFSEQLEQKLDLLAANAPSTEDIREVLEFMYSAPLKNKDNALAYWMLQAVHALTDKLIGFLSLEDSAALSCLYKESYPKSLRMPAQNKIALLLQAQSGEREDRKKRSLLEILIGRNRSN